MLRVIVPKENGAGEASPAAQAKVLQALLEKGYAVEYSDGKPSADGGHTAVLQREPAGAPEKHSGHLHWLNISGLDAALVVEKVDGLRADLELPVPGQWLPWFPVIDFERCTHCMQCLSFCLFGVYGVNSAKQIEVQHGEQCKTNCPACSRVCPEAAIIFPKYKTGPINGDAINDVDVQREKMKIDVSALLGGDIYQMLRDRSERAQSRFSKERDPDKALQERQRCLARLLQAADIPPEVLMALPSQEEIARRASEAMAKGQSAIQARKEGGQ